MVPGRGFQVTASLSLSMLRPWSTRLLGVRPPRGGEPQPASIRSNPTRLRPPAVRRTGARPASFQTPAPFGCVVGETPRRGLVRSRTGCEMVIDRYVGEAQGTIRGKGTI